MSFPSGGRTKLSRPNCSKRKFEHALHATIESIERLQNAGLTICLPKHNNTHAKISVR